MGKGRTPPPQQERKTMQQAENQAKKKHFRLNPPQTITLSFALMILTGAVLLSLPIASQDGQSVGFLNALFTATSANCVTGLVVVNTLTHWTMFGKVVILLLIQMGGLGFITLLTIGMVFLKKAISLENRLIIQASFNQDNVGGMVRLVRRVVGFALGFEAVGAVLLSLGFYFSAPRMSLGRAIWSGVFHAISAFCNAGFDIIGPDSLAPYRGNVFINLVFIALLVAGGLGFIVWSDLFTRPKIHMRRKRGFLQRWYFLSLHSKVVISVTVILLVSGTLFFLVFEWMNPKTLGPLPVGEKLLAAFFQSATLRTCGFATINQGGLTEPSQLLSSLLMCVGGSPAGTAGGMKTVTVGVVAISMLSALRGKSHIEAFGRTLPLELLQKALSVATAFLLVVVLSTFLLCFTESASPFPHTAMDLLFESASAAGTVGLTTGITPYLSSAGKIIITICMFLGRLSPVTVAVALSMRMNSGSNNVGYPSERVIIG